MHVTAKTLCTLIVAALTLALSAAQARTSFQSASAQARQQLEFALTELAQTRESIVADKIPLVREVNALEDALRQKTAELEQLRRLRDTHDLGLNRLREQVDAINAQNEYAAGLLDEFVRSFETRIHYSETPLYAKVAEAARLALDDADMSQADRFQQQLELITVALDRVDQLTGGYTFKGQALAPNGYIEHGTYAAFGPTVYFASDQSELAGVSFNKLNTAQPAIAILGESATVGIRGFIANKAGTIPVDATLGKALKMVESDDTILEHLAKGGSVGGVILGLGGICILLGTFKMIEVTRFKTASPENVQNVLALMEQSELDQATALAEALPGDGGALIRCGITHADEKRGTLEEILYEKILAARPRLERFLPFIALTAAAAPLLGLLGTVTGMIKTFNLITLFGSGDAKSLSSGISEALVTTELGLIVAIPALILHGLLSRMARQKLEAMEQTAVSFINGVSGSRHQP